MEDIQVIISQQAGTINFNFEEMKQFLNDRLEEYRGAVFTDDSIKSAKGYIAKLRKEQSALKSRISDVKAEYMGPFEVFKEKADELVRLYDAPICFIDGQVKDFEKRRKTEKREVIKSIYEKYAADVTEYIPLEKIYNPKWENVSFKKNAIVEEICNIVETVRRDVVTINGMDSEACKEALTIYKQDLSLANAIAHINNYERHKAEILTMERVRQRKEEEERIRREEREKLKAEIRAEAEREAAVAEAKEQGASEVIENLIPDFQGECLIYKYKMSLSPDAKEKLEMFLDSVGIEWELV